MKNFPFNKRFYIHVIAEPPNIDQVSYFFLPIGYRYVSIMFMKCEENSTRNCFQLHYFCNSEPLRKKLQIVHVVGQKVTNFFNKPGKSYNQCLSPNSCFRDFHVVDYNNHFVVIAGCFKERPGYIVFIDTYDARNYNTSMFLKSQEILKVEFSFPYLINAIHTNYCDQFESHKQIVKDNSLNLIKLLIGAAFALSVAYLFFKIKRVLGRNQVLPFVNWTIWRKFLYKGQFVKILRLFRFQQ